MSGLVSMAEAMRSALVPWEARAAAARRPAIAQRERTARQEIRASQWATSVRACHRLARQAAERKKRK